MMLIFTVSFVWGNTDTVISADTTNTDSSATYTGSYQQPNSIYPHYQITDANGNSQITYCYDGERQSPGGNVYHKVDYTNNSSLVESTTKLSQILAVLQAGYPKMGVNLGVNIQSDFNNFKNTLINAPYTGALSQLAA